MSRVSQARSLGKYFLLVDNMLVVLGFFVVFPLISIRFVDQMGWAALMVGIALGLRQFVQQGLGVFGGAIADRFGAKPMIVTGMLLRAAGFATMAVAHEPWLLWFSCFLSGIGGTLFDPPRTALVIQREGYREGPASLVSNMLSVAGLQPPARVSSGGGFMSAEQGGFVSLEHLLTDGPDVLVFQDPPRAAQDQGALFITHPALLARYGADRRIDLPERYTVCGGPSLLQGLDYLTKAIGVLRK